MPEEPYESDRPEGVPYGCCWCGCGGKTNVPLRSHRPSGAVAGVPRRYISGHNARRPGRTCSPPRTRLERQPGGRHANRAVDDEAEARIATDYLAGDTYATLMERHLVGPGVVSGALARQGVQRRACGPPPTISANEQAAMAADYRSGLSRKQIMAKYHRGDKTVRNALRRAGVKMRPPKGTGDAAANWKGGRTLEQRGYYSVWIPPGHPFQCMASGRRKNRVLEHRLVMATMLGRPLATWEQVHHINGVKTDNRPENLQLRSNRAHGPGVVIRCRCCGSQDLVYEEM